MSNEPTESGETRTVAAVETSLELIDALVDLQGATMAELSDHLDYSKSAIHSHLRTLENQGYVVREDHRYRPSLKFYDIGQRVAHDHMLAYRAGREEIEDLAKETGEDGWIMVEEFGKGIYIFRQRGRQGVDDFPIGRPSGLHCTAAGKAILANLHETQIDAILNQHGLPAVTQNTITTRDALDAELADIRDTGVAFSWEEATPGIRALACPLIAMDDTVFGSVSISGPASRLEGDYFETELADQLQETANIIEITAMNESRNYNF